MRNSPSCPVSQSGTTAVALGAQTSSVRDASTARIHLTLLCLTFFTHTHTRSRIIFLGKRTDDEYPWPCAGVRVSSTCSFFRPWGLAFAPCLAINLNYRHLLSATAFRRCNNVDVTPHSSVKQLLFVSAHAHAHTTACSTSSSASAEKHVVKIRSISVATEQTDSCRRDRRMYNSMQRCTCTCKTQG